MMSFDITELTNRKVNFIYSDPPWGEGNLKYWQTMNQKMNSVEPKEVQFQGFVNKFFHICDQALTDDGVVFMEYGPRWREDVMFYAKTFGFHMLRLYQPKYKAGSKMLPLDLFVFIRRGKLVDIELPDLELVNSSYGYSTLERVFHTMVTRPDMALLDPCCGMGYSAKLAMSRQMTFFGNELNEKRLAKTIDRLRKDV
jgi:hypothetical protein